MLISVCTTLTRSLVVPEDGSGPPDEPGTPNPVLYSAEVIDGILVMEADSGPLTLTIDAPSPYAGTRVIDTSLLVDGPVPITAPIILGASAIGMTLGIQLGLWVHDAAAVPTLALQWLRNTRSLRLIPVHRSAASRR